VTSGEVLRAVCGFAILATVYLQFLAWSDVQPLLGSPVSKSIHSSTFNFNDTILIILS